MRSALNNNEGKGVKRMTGGMRKPGAMSRDSDGSIETADGNGR